MSIIRPHLNFNISHKKVGDQHVLIISPSQPNEGYPAKEIDITAEQWDSLQYHFATAVNGSTGIDLLSYIV